MTPRNAQYTYTYTYTHSKVTVDSLHILTCAASSVENAYLLPFLSISPFLTYVRDRPDGFAVLAHDAPTAASGGNFSSLVSDVAERVADVFAVAFENAGYDAKSAPIYAHALVGMVTFVGQWWTESKKPKVEAVASHLAALMWMGLRHLPKDPAPVARSGD